MTHPCRARRLPRVAVLIFVALVTMLWMLPGVPAHADDQQVTAHQVAIRVHDGPERRDKITIDATVYTPEQTPAPAVIVSPGFGGTKKTAAARARDLAKHGFVVLAYTPRGFGNSGGKIALNSPDYEVADAKQLVDWLAARDDVVQDAPGDPRVGVTGASYGGALSLLLAGYDRRVDTIVPVITYNDLSTALLPNAAGTGTLPHTPAPMTSGAPGVFKKQWASHFFAAGLRGAGRPDAGGAGTGTAAPACGRFMPRVCAAYQELATTGQAGPATRRLLHRNSPASVTSHITIPTMLVQGEQDTLFWLGQADANARQIHAAGGSVRVLWYAGGHDGDPPGQRIQDEITQWLRYYLADDGERPETGFSYAVRGSFGRDGEANVRTIRAPHYPGLGDGTTSRRELPLTGDAQTILNPPGGSPAALSSIPGVGSALGAVAGRLAHDVPGEFAGFDTAPLSGQLLVAGSPTVQLRVDRISGGGGPATLFVKVYDVAPDGSKTLPGQAVAPIQVPGGAGQVTVRLAGVVAPVEAGHHLRVVVSTTDSAYANAQQPAVYRVSVDGGLAVPTVAGTSSATTPFPLGQVVAIGVVLLLCLLAALALLLRRRRAGRTGAEDPDVPLVLDGLSKTYRGKRRILRLRTSTGDLRVVDALSFRVERGQVLGLLGPNGAGKTTALRMLLGLVTPTAGTVRIFGHRLRPGAPVLSRVGSFVERPGFLPHLSGKANLRLFWRSTGRPESEARMDEALDVADLGDAIHRKVGTYSLGMRQRLAIAQAMLGMPELLILDEPTNGLDPPQIRDTREVLRRYAADGRTVLVSSHILAEVEQTCSHVVVMHQGRLVAFGAVSELVAGNGESVFAVDDPGRASAVLSGMDGVTEIGTDDHTVSATLGATPRSEAVEALVAAGVAVESAGPRGRLEDTFLRLVEEGGEDD